jgi:hypothetical protein
MSSYVKKYNAEGLLNTDWGDYGHVNLINLSIPGMIYGAAFSWRNDVVEFEEINRQISVVEYCDKTGEIMSLFSEAADCQIFTWRQVVQWKEKEVVDGVKERIDKYKNKFREQEIYKNIRNNLTCIFPDAFTYTQAEHA